MSSPIYTCVSHSDSPRKSYSTTSSPTIRQHSEIVIESRTNPHPGVQNNSQQHVQSINPQLVLSIQRSDGELQALYDAIQRIENTLSSVRVKSATNMAKARQNAKQSEVRILTLGEQLTQERERNSKLRHDLCLASNQLKVALEKNLALSIENRSIQEKLALVEVERGTLVGKVTAVASKNVALQQELNDYKNDMKSTKIYMEANQARNDKLQSQLTSVRAHMKEKTAALAIAAAAQRKLTDKVATLEERLAEKVSDNSILKRIIRCKSEQLSLVKNEVVESYHREEGQLYACEREIEHIKTENMELRGKLACLKCECKQLREENEATNLKQSTALQQAQKAFELLHQKLTDAENREEENEKSNSIATSRLAKAFDDVTGQLASLTETLREEKAKHARTRMELQMAQHECSIAQRMRMEAVKRNMP